MKYVSRFLSVLVFVLAVFCGFVLIWSVEKFPPAEVRFAKTAITDSLESHVPKTGESTVLSRLSMFPLWGKKKGIVSVMVENHQAARPFHRGLSDALLIEEFFVEGYITRFNVLFDVKDFPERVGPVRSLRPYFIDGVLPWVSVFFHFGGSPEALERVRQLKGVTAFNGIFYDTYFTRAKDIPAPHDAFLTRESMRELLQEVDGGVTPVLWPPYKTGRARSGSGAATITINFFSPLHNVEYVYDSWKRGYIRMNGEEVSLAVPHNVLILETDVEDTGEFGRLAIRVQGKGEALLFRSGRMYRGRWAKKSPTDSYVFTDAEGNPLVFSSGQTWVTVVDSLSRVKWKG